MTRRDGLEIAGLVVNRMILVRFPVYPLRIGPSAGKEVMTSLDVLGPRRVGSARKRPLAVHAVGARQQVIIWKLDNSPVTK